MLISHINNIHNLNEFCLSMNSLIFHKHFRYVMLVDLGCNVTTVDSSIVTVVAIEHDKTSKNVKESGIGW